MYVPGGVVVHFPKGEGVSVDEDVFIRTLELIFV
jgi:hypothetical protein